MTNCRAWTLSPTASDGQWLRWIRPFRNDVSRCASASVLRRSSTSAIRATTRRAAATLMRSHTRSALMRPGWQRAPARPGDGFDELSTSVTPSGNAFGAPISCSRTSSGSPRRSTSESLRRQRRGIGLQLRPDQVPAVRRKVVEAFRLLPGCQGEFAHPAARDARLAPITDGRGLDAEQLGDGARAAKEVDELVCGSHAGILGAPKSKCKVQLKSLLLG